MAKTNNSKNGKKSKGLRAINMPDCTLVPNELIENYLPLLSEIELKSLLILLQAHTFPQISFRGLTLNDIQKRLTSKSESVMHDNKYSESKIKQAVDYLIQIGLLTSREIEDTNIFRYYINLKKEVQKDILEDEKQMRKESPITELDTGERVFMDIERKHKVRSTFFFLNQNAQLRYLKPHQWKLSIGQYRLEDKKIRNIILDLDKEGWEIGVHGSYNSYFNKNLFLAH